MLRNILLGVGVFATLISILIFSGKLSVGNKESVARGDVVMWGTLPEVEMNNITQAFNPQAKTYAVRYRYIPEENFNQRLLEGLASGAGPDVIIAPYQTVLSQSDRIQPFPKASFTEKAFKDTYIDGASVLYGPEGALGLPVSVEPMVLFYNRTLFSKHGIVNPPQYWDEVISMVPILTLREGGNFVESGIALGTPAVPYVKDIIMAIVAQLGQSPVVRVPAQLGGSYFSVQANEPVKEGSEILPLSSAVRFYSQFGDLGQKTYSWSQNMGDATDFFVGERLAMYIGYSGEFGTLKSRNPRADFVMTTLPQTRGYNTFATGMRMYAVATIKSTKNVQAALTVQSQFAGAGVSPSIAAVVGGVSPLRNTAMTAGLDPVVAKSMLVARGWLDSHEKESSSYVASMISDVINYRYGVSDAATIFVSRMRDLYASKI